MKQLNKLWLTIVLGLVGLASCRKDVRTEPNTLYGAQDNKVMLHISAEIGFEDNEGDLKGLNFKIEDVNGKKIPRPQFADGEEIEVHTIVMSDAPGATASVKTLKWTYDASSKKLVLKTSKDPSQSITISGFNRDNGVKWYVAGLLAPGSEVTSDLKVSLSGERQLRAVMGNVGDELGHLNVPYWLRWTELKINTSTMRDGDQSYQEACIVEEAQPQFKPLGALIAFKLGNRLTGNYAFTPTGIMLHSNAYGNEVDFDFRTDVSVADELPKWQVRSSSMGYTFAPGHAPEAISYGDSTDKTYYAWVMPQAELTPNYAITQVKLEGSSNRPAVYQSSSRPYSTDYLVKTSGTRGRVEHGRIHRLSANATRRIPIPIEYMAEYNLAGGRLCMRTKPERLPDYPNEQEPDGLLGAFRFANRDKDNPATATNSIDPNRNDQSGYYTLSVVVGEDLWGINPALDNLTSEIVVDVNGDNVRLGDRYFLPEIDHWWGVLPSNMEIQESTPIERHSDYFQIGYGAQALRLYGTADYSRLFYLNGDGTAANSDNVIYALRFQEFDGSKIAKEITDGAYAYGGSPTYNALVDNSLRCAYRYTWVGGGSAWRSYSYTSRLKIDVVYLGVNDFKEAGKSELETISSEAWWRSKQDAGEVISRVLPANSYSQSYSDFWGFSSFGEGCFYWSSTKMQDNGFVFYSWHYTSGPWVYTHSTQRAPFHMSVRPFLKIED